MIKGNIAVPDEVAELKARELENDINEARIAVCAIERLAHSGAADLSEAQGKLFGIEWIARKLIDDLTEIHEAV
jgi:hypothetical protein